MKVLICDHDTTSRFVLKRMLNQYMPWTCLECGDCVEALQLIDEHDIGLVILDVDMPEVDGVEVLEAIRSSDEVKALPVIVLSRERREEVVSRLLRLGVSGYLLKPIRTEKLLAALEAIKDRLARRKPRRLSSSNTLCLGPDSPAMIIDGNLDFRHFFTSQTQMHGPVVGVPSGAAALAKFRQTPVPLVFVGGDLGILAIDKLVPKLRSLSPSQPIRVIGIVDSTTPGSHPAELFDDVMMRTYVPDKFKQEFKRYVKVPAALGAVTELAGDLGQNLASSARQVFGMMLDTEIETRKDGAGGGPFGGALVTMTLQQRYQVVLKVFASIDDLKAIASRMLQMPIEELTDEDYLSTGTELANLVTGRLKASLEERGVETECTLPRVETALTRWIEPHIDERGVVQHFGIVAANACMSLALEVSDPLSSSQEAA